MKKERNHISHITRLLALLPAGMLCLSGALLTSCEKEIEYNGPDEKPLLVVNIVAEAGGTVAVDVSHSVFFLDVSDNSINKKLSDAKVTLSVNGEAASLTYDKETLTYNDSRTLREGDEVAVKVTHATYGEATAQMTVPHGATLHAHSKSVPYESYRQDSVDSHNQFYGLYACRVDSVWKVNFVIDNAQKKTQFYRLTLSPMYTFRLTEGPGMSLINYDYGDAQENEDGTLSIDALSYYSIPATTSYALGMDDMDFDFDLDFLDIDLGLGGDDPDASYTAGPKTFLFSSDNLDGESGNTLSFDILMQTPGWQGGNYYYYHPDEHYITNGWYYYAYNPDEDHELVDYGNPWDIIGRTINYRIDVTLETLTSEYYYYLKSVDKYDGASWSPFSEPVQITCNINGGIGIMGATSTHTLSVQRESTFP